jgi:ribosome biogenesis GTPase A
MIQWYPGHMAKAKKEIIEKLKLVDIAFELVDARIPLSSQNPLIEEILKNKPKLVLMTKADLADSRITKKWQDYYKKIGMESLLIDSISGFNINKIINASKNVLEEKLKKNEAKGMLPRAIRAIVIGIPNVGKSTLINSLVGKKVTNVGDRPGVTKAQQWIRINKELELLDTPGVLWPKFDDQIQGYHLAISGAIRDQVYHKDDLIFYLFNFLKKHYPIDFIKRYNINVEDTNLEILDKIASNRGFFRNKDYDYEKTYESILNDFRNIRIGKITLDRPNNE